MQGICSFRNRKGSEAKAGSGSGSSSLGSGKSQGPQITSYQKLQGPGYLTSPLLAPSYVNWGPRFPSLHCPSEWKELMDLKCTLQR